MRIALISDVHANLEALQSTLRDMLTRDIDRIVCLGDIVGYHANPRECIDLLRNLNVLCVAGNHDRAVTGQISTDDFHYIATKAVLWTRRCLDSSALDYLNKLPIELSIPKKLVGVHGALHIDGKQETVRLDNDEARHLSFLALKGHPSEARVCAFGHTHKPGVFEFQDGRMQELTGDKISLQCDAWYLINPGSVGQSRTDDLRATYAILDFSQNEVSMHRVIYDFSTSLEKAHKAGLLPRQMHLTGLVGAILAHSPRLIRGALRQGLSVLR